MNILCPIPPQTCIDVPTINFSSETPDRERFIGRNPVNPDPPLGNWVSSGCVGDCFSDISQEDADLCAQRQSILCLCQNYPCGPTCPDGSSTPCMVLPPPGTPVPPNQPVVPWSNDEQSASFTCPDGSLFFYTVPAGAVLMFSKLEANASALSIAQAGAIANLVCIGTLASAGMCVGSPYTGTVSLSNPTIGQPGVTLDVTILSGVLPPGVGMVFGPNDFAFTGTPASTGTFPFTVKVAVTKGTNTHFALKMFTLYSVIIDQSSLAAGSIGTPYAQTMTVSGPTLGTVTWSVTSGALPPGLSLNPATGAITGTPTAAGNYTFQIGMTDQRP